MAIAIQKDISAYERILGRKINRIERLTLSQEGGVPWVFSAGGIERVAGVLFEAGEGRIKPTGDYLPAYSDPGFLAEALSEIRENYPGASRIAGIRIARPDSQGLKALSQAGFVAESVYPPNFIPGDKGAGGIQIAWNSSERTGISKYNEKALRDAIASANSREDPFKASPEGFAVRRIMPSEAEMLSQYAEIVQKAFPGYPDAETDIRAVTDNPELFCLYGGINGDGRLSSFVLLNRIGAFGEALLVATDPERRERGRASQVLRASCENACGNWAMQCVPGGEKPEGGFSSGIIGTGKDAGFFLANSSRYVANPANAGYNPLEGGIPALVNHCPIATDRLPGLSGQKYATLVEMARMG